MPKRVVILGAAGRDFHNFNVVYRSDPGVVVEAFTATQIPGVAGRRYPASLAGPGYPDGIPIEDEVDLEAIIGSKHIDEVVFAYSDVSHEHVMHVASRVLAAGADFKLLGPNATMLPSRRPVIAVTAVRTGCGKSQIARWISRRLRGQGRQVAALRHPMPYGDLLSGRVQRFASLADLDRAGCTAEEREEYEPHIAAGNVVFAGVDYRAILDEAEKEADVIVWDGGNNDFPFVRPDLAIVVVDALRPGQVDTHHPGETSARVADIVVINKVDSAAPEAVDQAIEAVRRINPGAEIVRAASPARLDNPRAVQGKRVMVVDDGPTLTHGGMAYGAGYAAAVAAGAEEIVDPRATLAPALAYVFRDFPHIGPVLPAMGYSPDQLAALAETVNRSRAEVVVVGTPIDLASLVNIAKPVVRARYGYEEAGHPSLADVVDRFLQDQKDPYEGAAARR
ncbi:MAG TPA: cyclic 2,3-diphosphoglycerate synthase [Acidimicrobiia bacterium]|nr:cyclic 2,3-diphosphoglycerate synthase [Acidimicrobiia bacterium]